MIPSVIRKFHSRIPHWRFWSFFFFLKKGRNEVTSGEEVGVCCHGTLAQPCADPADLAMCLWPFFSASGLPSGCRGLPSPAVFSLQWCSVPGMLLWMASTVQRPCRPLRAQVSGPGTKLGGGAGTQSPGWDTVHCWLLGMCISGICQVSHTCFPGPCLQPVLQPLSVKITFLFCTSVHADEILPLRILM